MRLKGDDDLSTQPVLKSKIEIDQVLHRLPDRIKAYASICLMALMLYRVMRKCIKFADSTLSTERIRRHSICIDNGSPVAGISTISNDQATTIAALKVEKITTNPRLPLLQWYSDLLTQSNQSLTAFGVNSVGHALISIPIQIVD